MTRILLVACLAWGAVAAASEPVAYVNGEPITREELDQATGLAEILFSLSQRFPSFAQSLLLTEEGKGFLARYERDVLEKLILQRVQVQEARARGLTVDEGEVERRTEETLNQIYLYYDLSEEEFAAELLSQRDSLERFRNDIARQHRENLLLSALKAAVLAEITVSEEEIQSSYNEDPERFVDEDGEPLPFPHVRERIAAILRAEKEEAHWQAWLAAARSRAAVEINL
ncbi:MAG TPA: hypothetical protein ENN53_00675 [Candidatus Acetothermia bacterium]|nr:hypothetical protein [Candidatus Acetothermia bacterium]